MRVDYNRLAFFATIAVLAVCVAIGKIPLSTLTALLAGGGAALWALPSPFTKSDPPSGGTPS